MGGSAFSSGNDALCTPRMPKDVYEAVKARCHSKLRELFEHVDSPIDGPGKQDFGDIDIVLAGPKDGTPSDQRDAVAAVAEALGAIRCIFNRGASSNLALPWPDLGDASTHKSNCSAPEAETGGHGAADKYIQVDIRILNSFKEMEWFLFRHGHGDLWSILGSIMRPYGLTVDEDALWLRIPEIEQSDKKRAKVFLTSDPRKVLEFAEIPITRCFDGPFKDAETMYNYIARSRFFWVPPLEPGQSRESAAAGDLEKLKSNDRRRMQKRPLFRNFFDQFVVQCRSAGRLPEERAKRSAITKEAFARFPCWVEYTARRNEFLLERQRDTIWNKLIKGSIPEPEQSDPQAVTYRACLVKALKRIILEDDESYGVSPDRSLKGEDGFYLMEDVADFISRYQDKVGEAAMARSNARYAEHMQAKAAKEAQASEEKQ